MIAADTSAWIDYSKGIKSECAKALEEGLELSRLVMPPLVLVELLSSPSLSPSVEEFIRAIPRLDLVAGYWERTAFLRRGVLSKGYKARLGDCLIAQSCIDQNVPLITGDKDFRHFKKMGLKIASI